MMLLLVSAIRAWNHIFPHGFMFSFDRLCNSILYVGELGFTIWAANLNIKHVSRLVLKNAETVEGSNNLSPVVLAPDVEHEDACNEEKGHDQNWNWANLNARTVISVESPHSTTASATSSYSWSLGRASSSSFSLPDSTPTATRARASWAAGTNICGTGCRSRHVSCRSESSNKSLVVSFS